VEGSIEARSVGLGASWVPVFPPFPLVSDCDAVFFLIPFYKSAGQQLYWR
jgi:hypothetical protein